MIDLSIVIVTWNARDVLLDALESIEREVLGRSAEGRIETETLVVDNGSSDGSSEAVRERFPWAEVIPLPENRGFAAGNNVGLRRARGRYAVLLNNDTVVLPDALERCVRHLDGHPDVGVVGPQLLNPDLSRQNCIHNYPSLWTELIPKGLLETVLPDRFPSKRFDHPGPIDVPAVMGACLFVRREVLDEVGLMPEDYFFFLEETDWCYRIARAGWRIVHVPDAHVVHIFGASSKKKIPAETRIEYHRSLYHFFRKNRGGGERRRDRRTPYLQAPAVRDGGRPSCDLFAAFAPTLAAELAGADLAPAWLPGERRVAPGHGTGGSGRVWMGGGTA